MAQHPAGFLFGRQVFDHFRRCNSGQATEIKETLALLVESGAPKTSSKQEWSFPRLLPKNCDFLLQNLNALSISDDVLSGLSERCKGLTGFSWGFAQGCTFESTLNIISSLSGAAAVSGSCKGFSDFFLPGVLNWFLLPLSPFFIFHLLKNFFT